MHNQLWHKPKEKMAENTPREAETGPVVSVLECFQAITIFELHLAGKVLLVKHFDGDFLFTAVLQSVAFVMEM